MCTFVLLMVNAFTNTVLLKCLLWAPLSGAVLSLPPAHYRPVNEKSRVFPVGPWEEAHGM